MNRYVRRASIGAMAGGVASVALVPALHHAVWTILLGVAVGTAFSVSAGRNRQAYLDDLMTGAALGVPLWGVLSIIAWPLLSGLMPDWSAAMMRQRFPSLIGWVLFGASLGLLTQLLRRAAERLLGPEPDVPAKPTPAAQRILILGGGFAGMKTAECLEEELRSFPWVSITVVSETNALLFTPMLAEVAGSSLEPSHISTPLRGALHRTEVVRGRVASIDVEKQLAVLDDSQSEDSGQREIRYDYLVLALGSVSNYLGLANVQKHSLDFKSLLDAIRIRNRAIEMFERADHEPDAERRRSLLTFVIAGGGFAGVELAGALNDFARGMLADFPNLHSQDVRVVLVHARDRILPELSESLGRYAQTRMEARGVEFHLSTRLTDAGPGTVSLSDGVISAETLVWTAGTVPNPLTLSLPVERDKRGAIIVEPTLAVRNHPGVWALGDCAAVTDAKSGKPCPPTAQFALREAAAVARNIRATVQGRASRGFHFDSLGALCVIGHQTACAELTIPFARSRTVRFSGLMAWLMWRGIYLGKLPGLERKIRVLMDWTVELFFPRDIVQTVDLK